MQEFIPYGRQEVTEEDIQAINKVLRSPYLTQGEYVPTFERKICDYTGAKFGVAVNSATSALHLACIALDLKEGDWLWTTPNSFVASANCGVYCGANIEFVDIDIRTGLIDVEALERKIDTAARTDKLPKIIVVVHLTGTSCEMEKISAVAKRYEIKIIEDASHAIGGEYRGDKIGNGRYSDITVFSFHPVKIITTGEGGIAVCNDERLATRMRKLRSHGITKEVNEYVRDEIHDWSYEQQELGYNYRMTDIHASLGCSQINRLDKIVLERNRIKEYYKKRILEKDIPIRFLEVDKEILSSVHLAVIILESYDKTEHANLFRNMRSNGIGVQIHYAPIHLQPYYRRLGYKEGDFPNAERYEHCAISIPVYPGLTTIQQEKVVNVIDSFYHG